MKKLIVALVALMATLQSSAQQAVLDSLLQELNRNKNEDSIRLSLLNNIAYTYYTLDPEKGIIMANKALELAQKINNTLAVAEASRNKAINYWAKGEDSLALLALNDAYAIYNTLQNEEGLAKVYVNRGMIYNAQGAYQDALKSQNKALRIFETLHDTLKIAQAMNGIGITYLYLSNYPEALSYYLNSLKLYESVNNEQNIANEYTNIALVYSHMTDFKKALFYNEKAVALYKKFDNKRGLANTLGNIGNLYDDMDSSQKALQYYLEALEVSTQMGNKRNIASNLSNIGVVYNNLKQYDKALDYLNQALQLNLQLADKNSLALIYSEIGRAYTFADKKVLTMHGVLPANRLTAALASQQKGLQLAREIEATDKEAATLGYISTTYELMNKPLAALATYKQSIALKDSIQNDEKKEAIVQMQMQYEFDKKQALIKAENDKKHIIAQAEINRQKMITLTTVTGAVVLIFVAILVFALYRKKRAAEARRIEAELQAQLSEVEMKALRAQMNPHFIFNSLNSIIDYIDKHPVTATTYTTKFARLMRMILENSEKREIPLADELAALELYMQLEAMRMNNKFTYEIRLSEGIDAENTLIPPLLLQPFVENSIWHGLSAKDGNGKIVIDVQQEGDLIKCIVEDDGVGRSVNDDAAFSNAVAKRSLGMKITKSRIDILNKVKNTTGNVAYADLPTGTRAEVTVPYQQSF